MDSQSVTCKKLVRNSSISLQVFFSFLFLFGSFFEDIRISQGQNPHSDISLIKLPILLYHSVDSHGKLAASTHTSIAEYIFTVYFLWERPVHRRPKRIHLLINHTLDQGSPQAWKANFFSPQTFIRKVWATGLSRWLTFGHDSVTFRPRLSTSESI